MRAKVEKVENAGNHQLVITGLGTYKAPAADALAGFADTGKVSSWARESVAWAVENGIMGNGGVINPKADINRAEAAARAVAARPSALRGLIGNHFGLMNSQN